VVNKPQILLIGHLKMVVIQIFDEVIQLAGDYKELKI